MKRFFVKNINIPMHTLTDDSHHHVVVCRLKCGDNVILCIGDGIDHVGIIEKISKNQTIITIQKSIPNDTEPNIILDLFFAPLTPANIELVIIKGTELGVSGFYPTVTDFTQGRAAKLQYERLNRLILESAKQCGRAKLPVVSEVIRFNSAVEMAKWYNLAVLCYEGERENNLQRIFKYEAERSISRECVSGGERKKVAVFVGPEGGYNADEIALAKRAGLHVVTLGKRILRAETAAITSAAIILQNT